MSARNIVELISTKTKTKTHNSGPRDGSRRLMGYMVRGGGITSQLQRDTNQTAKMDQCCSKCCQGGSGRYGTIPG